MAKINVLSFEIANLIAAGEVVERPASVLKELIENSIDAGATSITAEIKRGGVAMIRVTDNGCGIDKEDLPILCLRLALVDALFKEQGMFVILDDPFVNLDDAHTAQACKLLRTLAEKRQILYLTCHSSRSV